MDVEMESINENTQLITILEIQGVRCSTKSFQIDIELKQIMVLKPVNLFEKCIIKSKQSKENLEKDLVNNKTETNSVKTPNIKILTVDMPIGEPQRNEVPIDEDFVDNNVIKMHISELSKDETSKDETSKDEMTKDEMSKDETSKDEIPGDEMSRDETSRDETSQAQTHVDELFKNDTSDILEIDLDIDEIETSNIFHLKEKTEIYYQMYKEARQKAKLAKSLALSSYLEARRIKNLYMLDNIDESDESDLEDLDNLEK
jgi:pentapeptide MXKDX repeat protein